MNKGEIYLTREGAARLRAELEELRGEGREALAARLRQAVQQGDLTENADYIAAKEEQAFLEGKILELETILREAVVVDNDAPSDEVRIGSTVLVSADGSEPEEFQLVGVKEADPRRGKISHESPIGQALLGKRKGDVVTAKTPGGKSELRILRVD